MPSGYDDRPTTFPLHNTSPSSLTTLFRPGCDVELFLNERLKRMVVVTKDREFILTMPETGVNVSTDEIIKKWNTAKLSGETGFEAWKEAFHGTGIICDENRYY